MLLWLGLCLKALTADLFREIFPGFNVFYYLDMYVGCEGTKQLSFRSCSKVHRYC